jgi:predicted metal-dependent phosphoesterase TrpH
MIDLHAHTTESDGTLAPRELIEAAARAGLEALAITDHDTFAGFDQAVPAARERALDLVCGIELSTKFRTRTVHLLGYFLDNHPGQEFRDWILRWQQARHRRNRELIAKLQRLGFGVKLEEVYRLGGTLPGRPHFAAILVQKGYFASTQQAFDECLGETGTAYVVRDEASFAEAVQRIAASGGFASLPHPGRVTRDPLALEEYLREMRELGLRGIEVYHSDHSAADTALYKDLAERLGLTVTGGSDFHGAIKPHIELGTGRSGNLNIPRSVLDDLRRAYLPVSSEPRS